MIDEPDFFCIGAQKAGTGWLYEQLRDHPDFWMPPVKELHYFDRALRTPRKKDGERIASIRAKTRSPNDIAFLEQMERLFQRTELDLDAYAQLFAEKGGLISGDITPGYSTLPDETVKQITARFPALKVIFLARDPVERAWSHLSMWIRHGRIAAFDPCDVEEVSRQLARPEVRARSFATEIVRRWRKHVPETRFRVYFFDDLKRDSAMVRGAAIGFLGGDPQKSSGMLATDHNPKAKLEKLELTEKVRAHMARFFHDEILASARELGGPAAQWPARYGL